MANRKECNSDQLELPIIINKPQLQPRWQRGLLAVAATFAWLLWFYLLMPVLTMVGWFFNLNLFGQTMAGELVKRSTTLFDYSLIIGALGSILIIWAFYNYFRFKGRDQRSSPPPLRVENLSRSFHLLPEQVRLIQKAQVVRVWHDENGDIAHVERLCCINVHRGRLGC
ncbi:poly-beta-1,6-N-acetyl-D-glucosamine biosynthesis protein PgaD [Salinisphaera sp. LB1]|uniref:poly-beta-1,6-N-acetyl-D-glucosamine biosynthesis protein PgaD n=1 Tax=Salinisphaera sp. LB1 TaxID=2183911 RepID=UPI000FF202C4|nr:poly-beta-1,6-N-acetyl-D-glucosamine biosynthesis protein PgaD [Salinisphaera sp. LB1]